MFSYEDTLILFGRSPFINEIADYIPKLCNKYHTMGCNYFCNSFPQVEYVIFFDDINPKVNNNHTIITNVLYLRRKNANCRNLLESHEKKELYVLHKNKKDFASDINSLNFCIHTPSIAFDWANKKGFKNVVIAGIDLTLVNQHFDYKTTPDGDGHTFQDKSLLMAREHLYNVAAKKLNIFQLNPKSDLKIPKISIEILLA